MMRQETFDVKDAVEAARAIGIAGGARTPESIPAIVRAMERFEENLEVQKRGILALSKFASMRKKAHCDLIENEGGCRAIVRAMTRFQSNEAVHIDGIWALFQICATSSTTIQRVIEDGGLDAVLRAMRRLKTSKTVQVRGYWAIQAFACRDIASILRMKGIATVIEGMRRFQTDQTIQRVGCSALKNLASNTAGQERIAGQGGIAAIFRAAGLLKQSANGQAAVLGALRNLAAHPSNQGTIFDLDGAKLAREAMRTFPVKQGNMHAQACALIGNLAMCPRNRDRLAEEGYVAAISVTLKNYGSVRDVVREALWALYALAWNSPANRARIEKEIGLKAMESALECLSPGGSVEHKEERRSIKDVMRAIDAVMRIPIKDFDARGALLAALRQLSLDTHGTALLASSAARVYRTRNSGAVRYLLCCVAQML
eukprot:g3238.t1